MKIVTTLCLLLLVSLTMFGQDNEIDSLKQAIENHKAAKDEVKRVNVVRSLAHKYSGARAYYKVIDLLEPEIDNFAKDIKDEEKTNIMIVLINNYYKAYNNTPNDTIYDKSIALFEKMIPYLEKSDNKHLVGSTYSAYGSLLMDGNENEKAIPILKKSFAYFEKHGKIDASAAICMGKLSNAYSRLAQIETSIQYARKGREIAKEIGNDAFVARFSISIGEAALNLELVDLAFKSFETALKAGRKLNDPFITALSLSYLGAMKMDIKNRKAWEVGKTYLEEAISLFSEMGDEYYFSDASKKLAYYYENIKDYKQALIYNQASVNYGLKYDDIGLQASAYTRHGRYHSKLNQLDSARFYLQKSIEFNKETKDHEGLKKVYFNIAQVEAEAENYKAAYEYHQLFTIHKDSLFAGNLRETIGKESVTQDVEGAVSAKKEAELEAEILASRNNLYLAIALGLLGILLIGGYLFQQLRKTRKQLETQNLQLTQLNDTKDRFFGIIAHDIRGPITSLDGIGEQMSYYLKKNNTERLNLLTSQVDKTSKKLTNLLDNLLNWALMQKGTIPYTPQSLDLEEVVQENIELYAEVAAMKNIQLQNKVEKGTLAYADMSAVTTIIRNLVNNAVKFTTDGDTISINTKSEKGKIFIEINDTGTGISANKLEKIFLLNTERKQGTSGEKGSGLGLLLCKDLVKLNKGTIKAVSELGKGSTFIFSLPIV
jgi:signal transduction histidine kinase